MTSLISWIGIDQRGPASIYIASDSRISWTDGSQWDFARKVFASKTTPQLFGYCGDVAFPSQVLGQLVSVIDSGQASSAMEGDERRTQITDILDSALRTYPNYQRRAFSVLYAARTSEKMTASFEIYALEWSPIDGWNTRGVDIPTRSDVVIALGSGTGTIQDVLFEWNKTEVRETSRGVFGAFCEAIRSGADPHTGGAPQLVGLYRIGPAREFAIICDNGLYLNGMRLGVRHRSSELECRNEVFERCSASTMQPLPDAQRQPRPSRL